MLDMDIVGGSLHLTSLNHVSMLCRSVEKSLHFYQHVLGFIPVRRPESLNFEGAWLFAYGIGIHLLQAGNPESLPTKSEINPKDNHISFQCENMTVVERKLKEMGIEYVQSRVEEGGVYVDQLFFHDPDGFMIEICNCENLPVVYLDGEPAGAVCSRRSFKKHQQPPPSPQMVKCVTAVSVKEDYLSCAGFYREGSNC